MNGWKEREEHTFLRTGHRRLGLTIVRGSGTRVWDDEGREYLDFIAGWAALSLGHAHPVVVNALKEQADTLMHVTNDAYTMPQILLAEVLLDNSPFDRAYFQNSGSEAVELAIKIARKYGKERQGGAYEIIVADHGFHGRTLGALSAGGTPAYRDPFEPLVPGFVHVPFNDIHAIKMATSPVTSAVLLEPIQGEGGVIVPDDGYLRAVRDWCDARGLLLVLDEVQTGMSRTGKLFAFEHDGIEPDVIAIGKGLGGGVPVSAVLMKEKVALFGPGDHGTTFGGNPLLTAVAHATVRYMLDTDLPARVQSLGSHLMQRLVSLRARFPQIVSVRGKGLLAAIEFDREFAPELVRLAAARGLMLNPVRPNTLRLSPPLTVSEAEIDQAVEIIEETVETAVAAEEVPQMA